jgi:hypothetical protein
MNQHWSVKYIGQAWTPTQDCYYWFREILKNEFGIKDLPLVTTPHDPTMRAAARLLTPTTAMFLGWLPTDKPVEGDAA